MKDATVGDILAWLDAIAPFSSAESYDNVGLLAGDPSQAVHTVFFTLDLSLDALERAIALEAELVITHHPLIFSPIRRIDYTIPQGQILRELAARRMNLIAAHTNWDAAEGGVSDALARTLCLTEVTRGDIAVRAGQLPRPMSPEELGAHILRTLNAIPRRYGGTDKPISRIAAAPGAYGEGARLAYAMGAQAYITGEIHHHEILLARDLGLVVYDAGHAPTEQPGVFALYHRFLAQAERCAWAVEAHADAISLLPHDGDDG